VDAVLPLATASVQGPGTLSVDSFLGTGFIVGQPQRLITARHVVGDLNNVVGLRVQDKAWISVGFGRRYDHPYEDICVYDLVEQIPCIDWFQLSAEEQFSSGDYSAWGYPDDIFYDQHNPSLGKKALPLPDIVYSAGHLRRRVSYEIPALWGAAFCELSAVIGAGASGGPVLTKRRGRLEVIGVYIGERTMQTGTSPPRQVGYALRLAAVADWLRTLGLDVKP